MTYKLFICFNYLSPPLEYKLHEHNFVCFTVKYFLPRTVFGEFQCLEQQCITQ